MGAGWNSWCSFGPCGTDVCTHDQVNATLTAIAQNGMRDLGYNYFTLDVRGPHPPFFPQCPLTRAAVCARVRSELAASNAGY